MKTLRNKNKIWLCLALLVSVILFSFLLLQLSGSTKKDDSADTLVLLGNEILAPIVYNENGRTKGIAVDIAEAIGEKIGYKIKVHSLNWDQAQKMVSSGHADGLVHINPDPERRIIYDFSNPLLKSEFSIFTRDDNTSLETLSDLRGKNIGVEASSYPSILVKDYNDIKAIELNDWTRSFEDLASGQLDALIIDRWIGEYELAQSKIQGIRVVEKPIVTQYSAIAVRKGDKEKLDLINDGLEAATKDGTIDRINRKWQGKQVIYITQDYFKNLLLLSAFTFLVLVALVSTILFIRYRSLSKKFKQDVEQRTEELRHANSQLKAANAKLEQISMIDSLTKIRNRRAFDIAYRRAWSLSMREASPLALISIDIDHYKVFNDTYGHLEGDQVLKSVAKTISASIKRPGDLAARYGGEEFLVMLMNTTCKGAEQVAERIRKDIEALEIKNKAMDTVLTVSIGVVSIVPSRKMSPKDLLAIVDKALYKAKEEGRNKVVVCNKIEELIDTDSKEK